MIDIKHINPEDLSLYAMRLLSPDESKQIKEHLLECSLCDDEFRAAQADLQIVALSVEVQTPSPAVRDRFLDQVAREKRTVPINRPVVAVPVVRPGSSGKVLPWLGWAVAAGVTVSAASLYRERQQLQTTVADQSQQLKAETSQLSSMSQETAKARAIMDALTSTSAMRVTLNATPAAKALPQGRATYMAEKGMLVFMANNLSPLPAGKIYELWLIPANGTVPIPAGLFHADVRGNANIVSSELPVGTQAKAFGVTIENEGGANTPTLPIILVGA